jgi:uncharacterized protein (TIGR02246 family)
MTTTSAPIQTVLQIYETLLKGWNNQEARSMGDLFAEKGNVVGFDGSQLNGPAEIVDTLGFIFSQHPTARYVSIVREVRLLSDSVALLRATVGMVPRQGKEINPAVNSVQSLVLEMHDDKWKISLFQNTPAAWHGRPEDQEKLTRELNAVLASGKLLENLSI